VSARFKLSEDDLGGGKVRVVRLSGGRVRQMHEFLHVRPVSRLCHDVSHQRRVNGILQFVSFAQEDPKELTAQCLRCSPLDEEEAVLKLFFALSNLGGLRLCEYALRFSRFHSFQGVRNFYFPVWTKERFESSLPVGLSCGEHLRYQLL